MPDEGYWMEATAAKDERIRVLEVTLAKAKRLLWRVHEGASQILGEYRLQKAIEAFLSQPEVHAAETRERVEKPAEEE